MSSNCALCNKAASLKLSHFIPKFIGRWYKDSSITGYLRSSLNPLQRQQDLYKDYLLCADCEEKFSSWETKFAEKVFYPYLENKKAIIEYGDWLLKFCVSLSWRSCVFIISHNDFSRHDKNYQEEVFKCKKNMEEFLLGNTDTINPYEQHLYPLDEIESTTLQDLPTNINRYLLRGLGMDIVGNRKNTFIYTKIPYFILIGVVKTNESQNMRTSAVKNKKGELSPRRYTMPKGFHQYLYSQANKIIELDNRIPQHQQKKLHEYLNAHMDEAIESNTMRAFLADYRMFGNDALKKN